MLSEIHQTKLSELMIAIESLQSNFLITKSLETRKLLGQFFTEFKVSNYMASLINKPESKTVRILDAGAGTGVLTVSTVLGCINMGCKSVHAVLYELDSEAVPYLDESLKTVEKIALQNGAEFTYKIHCKDFILSRPDKEPEFHAFDISVINPPYFKYSVKESPYSKATSDLFRGDPNIYASFMAVVMSCLKIGGQMVVISPRSFTNGLYFKGLRSYLFNESALEIIHIFKRRDILFNKSDSTVLQENIICKFVKGVTSEVIAIRATDCKRDMSSAEENKYPSDLIIDPSNDLASIRIPESKAEAEVLKQAEMLATTFKDSGYFISTGPVVEHRTRSFITEDNTSDNTVPLYRPHNVKLLTADWSGKHKKDASFILNEGHEKHTIENKTYVLLKRFSSKDEKRRLVAGVHLAKQHNYELIGFGNKTNYIGVVGNQLSDIEAFGVAAILNSSFMDKYFRCISGSTQVNATDIRGMRFPTREQVIKVGEKVSKIKSCDVTEIDEMVNQLFRN